MMALRQRDRIVKKNMDIISKNLALLEKFCQKYSTFLKWDPPMAGSIAFPVVNHGNKDILEFCEQFVQQRDCLLLPSSVYGSDFSSMNRVRFGLGRENIEEGLSLLGKFFESMRK